MGELDVKLVSTQKQLNNFTKCLLQDVQAMERMLEEGWFETDVVKIGAEQEICLIDKHYKPAPISLDLLKKLDDERFTTELAQFNIEANLTPRLFRGGCFSDMEAEINEMLGKLRETCHSLEVDFVLTGILPTIRKFDLGMDNLTPLQRYHALVKAIKKLRGKVYELRIKGIDELNIKHDSAMLEACNTSFQVHLQVSPDDFVNKYNNAQAVAAPVLALACNSPLLFGRRLWSETRVALFQQSIDTRITSEHLRERSPRVTFGSAWLRNSIMDLYKEDITRFRVMLMTDIDQNVFDQINEGITPKLKALTIHNSTVYRWNRPCYGISENGKPHLRIENRVLPSGPSVIDEVSNAAFWLGIMEAFGNEYPDVTQLMDFDDAKANFLSASRSGLDTELTWINGQKIGVSELIKKELIPIAKQGLKKARVKKEDIDKYMGIIEERNATRKTGTSWLLNCFSSLSKETTREETSIALTSAILKNQVEGKPIAEWEMARMEDIIEWHPASLIVEEFMTTDLFTVHQDDILELVADIMDWQNIRYTLVEDEKGQLKGLISARRLLKFFSAQFKLDKREPTTVKELMVMDPIVIEPDATIGEAMQLFNKNKIGCLPVVKNRKLVGVVTESNFIGVASSLLKIISKKSKTGTKKPRKKESE